MREDGLGAPFSWDRCSQLAGGTPRCYPCRHEEGELESAVCKPSPALGVLIPSRGVGPFNRRAKTAEVRPRFGTLVGLEA